MKSWQEDHVQSLLEFQTEESLFALLQNKAAALGFDYCAYGFRTPLPLSNPRTVTINNYPRAWQVRYHENGYLSVDPTVRHALNSTLPVLWSDEVSRSNPEMWEEARAFGLRVGLAQPYHGAYGTIGLLTLARSGDSLTIKELRKNEQEISWLSHVAHIGMSRCYLKQMMPETQTELTSREVEILRWTAEGKTAADIANILGISKRTVDFHASNAASKLGCCNKTAAVIQAALLGFLQ